MRGLLGGLCFNAALAQMMSEQERHLAQGRMIPHGRRRLELEVLRRRSRPTLRLCAFDLWLVAQYTQQPTCVFFAQREVGRSYTYLPTTWVFNLHNFRPIGLIQTDAGWYAATVRPGVELPPVRIGGWGPGASGMTKTWSHGFRHASHNYASGT